MAAAIIPQTLPVGYRFHPTDEEFVDHYLMNRVQGYVDRPCIIPDIDICSWDPWELPDKFHGASMIGLDDQVQEWWFFCPYTPQQVKRSTPSGYWKKTGADRNVKARNTSRVIGTKKTLVFHRGRGTKGVKTNWVIHEYHLLTIDSNRTYVLCRLKHKRDEKADNSTPESARGTITLADFDLDLHEPEHEGSFPEPLVQAKMKSLMEHLHQPENRAEFNSADLLRLLQPANNSFPTIVHQRANIESPSVMDISLDNGLTDESNQLTFGASEEDEDVGDMQNADLPYDDFFDGYMQTEYGQTSNSHNHPVLMNRRAQTTESVHGFVPLEEKKGMVENKFNSSPAASEKPKLRPVPEAPHRPMAPPIRPASVKRYGKDEEPRFEKVKKETAAVNIKPECISLDETASRAKVLGYKEHGSAGNSVKKTSSKETEHAGEISNSVAAPTGTTSESTESYTNHPLPNLVNVLVGIFLLLAITSQVLDF
ncbi:NAC domain-containing protein 2-like [Rhodamnia argentea]|uniref:NAC domain-containing protein 2-like n=1 Tax=Rhodamnia argentea TaxID=178133 RepID=A0A8B8PBC5_9MYRT|nr:NAC domain-containing protein 2-like [Rhodamnia argentea]